MNKKILLGINVLFFILLIILFIPYYEINNVIINLIIIYPLLNIVFILLNKDWKILSFLMIILNLAMSIYTIYGIFVTATTNSQFFSIFLRTILIDVCYIVPVFLNLKYSTEKTIKLLKNNREEDIEIESSKFKSVSSRPNFYNIIVEINKIFVIIFLFIGLFLFLFLTQIPENTGLFAMAPMLIYSVIFFIAVTLFLIYYLFYFLRDVKNITINKIVGVINKIINIITFGFLLLIFLFILYGFLK